MKAFFFLIGYVLLLCYNSNASSASCSLSS